MKPKVQADRRQYTRYETDLKIQFFVTFDIKTKIHFQVKDKSKAGFSKAKYTAFSRNISAEGLAFRSEKKLEHGDILSLEVFVPSADKPIPMVGEVRWCTKMKETEEYDTGVKLNEVEGMDVGESIVIDPIHRIAWSIVLETVFGEFKDMMLKKSSKK